MRNRELGEIYKEMADLLELSGENPFKARAYRKVGSVLKRLKEDIADLYQQGQLREIDGVGPEIAASIQEYFETGKIAALSALRAGIPGDLAALLTISGLGPKSIKLLHQELGLTTLTEIWCAAKANQLQRLPGLGPKMEATILQGIEQLQKQEELYPLHFALEIARELLPFLNALPAVQIAELTGSARRGKEMVHDLDILVATPDPFSIQQSLQKHPTFQEILEIEKDRLRGLTHLGIAVELIFVEPGDYALAQLRCTGSRSHWQALQKLKKGHRLRARVHKEEGDLVGRAEESALVSEEFAEQYYQDLGMAYIPPELRENQGEIEAATLQELPNLIKQSDIKGDLHVHSNWSDGIDTLEQMAKKAQSLGYQYLAITDHSKSLRIAGGIDEAALQAQGKQIESFNREHPDFLVLKGIEVDILPDGTLDFDEEVLRDLDLVVASIHTGFRNEENQLTQRVLAALQNPQVDIFGHPTGRILGRRSAYSLDVSAVLQEAVQTETAVELNASPDRLDLNAFGCRELIRQGGLLAVNTDAHQQEHLNDMELGVQTARRGWVTPESVINAWPKSKLLRWLNR